MSLDHKNSDISETVSVSIVPRVELEKDVKFKENPNSNQEDDFMNFVLGNYNNHLENNSSQSMNMKSVKQPDRGQSIEKYNQVTNKASPKNVEDIQMSNFSLRLLEKLKDINFSETYPS